jgi:hypothetical protein
LIILKTSSINCLFLITIIPNLKLNVSIKD